MPEITIKGLKCSRCGYEWAPRFGEKPLPISCAKCKSPYWNTLKTKKRKQ